MPTTSWPCERKTLTSASPRCPELPVTSTFMPMPYWSPSGGRKWPTAAITPLAQTQPRPAVEQFTSDLQMAGVGGRLLDHVEHYPAHRRDLVAPARYAGPVVAPTTASRPAPRPIAGTGRDST